MPRFFPYDASWDTLNKPCKPPFFNGWRPTTEASLCCELSRLAYCQGQTVVDALAPVGLQVVREFSEAGNFGTYGVLVRNDTSAYLVFRGTQPNDPSDIFHDALIAPVSWQAGGNVHFGFKDALFRVWSQIEPLLGQIDVPLTITGHSLGAALATLAASLVHPKQLVTFGSPRVGDAEFVSTLTGAVSTALYVDCCDIVTQLPQGLYVPAGELHYIHRHGDIHVNATDDFVKEDRDAGELDHLIHFAWRKGMTPTRHLSDHSPFNYVSALVGAQGQTP